MRFFGLFGLAKPPALKLLPLHISMFLLLYYIETLELSAKGSYDPDGVLYETPSYTWQILTSDGGSVIKDGAQRVLSYDGYAISVNVQRDLTSNQKYKVIIKN